LESKPFVDGEDELNDLSELVAQCDPLDSPHLVTCGECMTRTIRLRSGESCLNCGNSLI